MTDFQQRFQALKREYAGKDEWDRCEVFKAFHLEWAAALEATDPQGAMTQYSLAEECQWTIGTFSTGGGEGLASMSEVYRIMGLRADLLERQLRFGDALELWVRIQADPNGLGEDTPADVRIARLRSRMTS